MIGAHPDDCELKAGGTCVEWLRAGFRVMLVSLTNGDAGHHEMAGGPLARRRAAEAGLAAERAGLDSLVLDNHDAELSPSLGVRKQVVRIIRTFEADVVVGHRANDYHPDHRAAAQAVQDAAYMVTVPNFCPDVPVLKKNPVFLCFMDSFTNPAPFRPDVAVDVGNAMEVKWQMLDAMESQVYEWLPWHEGNLHTVPEDAQERFKWLQKTWDPSFRQPAKGARAALAKWYGKAAAAKVRYAEFFEISEYGHRPSKAEIREIFPFKPANVRKKARQ